MPNNYLGFEPETSEIQGFISYKREDASLITPYVKALHDKGVPLWYDYGVSKGDDWEEIISEQIYNSKYVLLFVTPQIFKSKIINRELKIAEERQKKILPVFMQEMAVDDIPPGKSMMWTRIKESNGIDKVWEISKADAVEEIYQAISKIVPPTMPEPTYDDPSNYKYEETDGGMIITGLENSALTVLKIPRMIDSKPVTKIGRLAFFNCSFVTEIIIPDSVTEIGYRAFWYCRSLTKIIISSGVTSMGEKAFEKCLSLKQITIPYSVTSIGSGMFMDCSSLTSITIPNSVTSIYNNTFSGCGSLKQITIPDSVTEIGDWLFYNCSSLKQINLPNGITTIGDSAFYGCSSLTEIAVPQGVATIGNWAFYNCTSLTSITIPNSVTSIGESAFYNCAHLTIHAPAGSYAAEYAEDNHIPLKLQEQTTSKSKSISFAER